MQDGFKLIARVLGIVGNDDIDFEFKDIMKELMREAMEQTERNSKCGKHDKDLFECIGLLYNYI